MSQAPLSVSVVIVTRDRQQLLAQAILSLLLQQSDFDELVVIDNASTDGTKDIVMALSHRSQVPIRYFFHSKKGYPTVYNWGLRKARSKWVAFLDDDCVADRQWLTALRQQMARFPQAAVFMGESRTYHHHNMFSLVTLVFDRYWKSNGRVGQR